MQNQQAVKDTNSQPNATHTTTKQQTVTSSHSTEVEDITLLQQQKANCNGNGSSHKNVVSSMPSSKQCESLSNEGSSSTGEEYAN